MLLLTEATVRTLYGTTDWFKIEKGGRQDCLLSPCWFNLYTEHIMRNAGVDELQAGIKIGGTNINNLRCVCVCVCVCVRVCVRALVTQSCPILCNPIDCSLPGSSVHGILQARILVWVVIPSLGDLLDPGIEPWFPNLQAGMQMIPL